MQLFLQMLPGSLLFLRESLGTRLGIPVAVSSALTMYVVSIALCITLGPGRGRKCQLVLAETMCASLIPRPNDQWSRNETICAQV